MTLTWKKKYTTGINTNICSGDIDKHIQNPLKYALRKKKVMTILLQRKKCDQAISKRTTGTQAGRMRFLGGTKKRETKLTAQIARTAQNNIYKIRKNSILGTFFRIENRYFQRQLFSLLFFKPTSQLFFPTNEFLRILDILIYAF